MVGEKLVKGESREEKGKEANSKRGAVDRGSFSLTGARCRPPPSPHNTPTPPALGYPTRPPGPPPGPALALRRARASPRRGARRPRQPWHARPPALAGFPPSHGSAQPRGQPLRPVVRTAQPSRGLSVGEGRGAGNGVQSGLPDLAEMRRVDPQPLTERKDDEPFWVPTAARRDQPARQETSARRLPDPLSARPATPS